MTETHVFSLLIAAFFFCFGAVIGSFLNVVILRFGTGRGLGGRSSCGSCHRTLGILDLVPIASFLLLGGRCRTCRTRLSWQYPLVELLTAALFVAVYTQGVGTLLTGVLLGMVCLCVCIAVYDAMHMRIPVVWNYGLVVLSTLFVLLTPAVDAYIRAASGLCIVGGLFLGTYWLSRGRVLGFGDVILAASIGLVLGPTEGLFAVWVGCILGSVFGLYQLGRGHIRARKKNMLTHHVPFGPFLVAGFLLVLLGYVSFAGTVGEIFIF